MFDNRGKLASFTDYLHSLGPRGEPADTAAYEAARRLLEAELVREMMRRGLWSASPRYLGLPGDQWRRELIAELVSDCYEEIFILRLGCLKNQLLVRGDVEGLITRAVRNFLHDLRKAHDPLGFRVYEILKAGVERLCEAGILRLASSTGKIHNSTVCAFARWRRGAAVAEVDLRSQVRAWNDDLWPELITANGRARRRVAERLDAHLASLAEDGIEAFRFGDLVVPMKTNVRHRWLQDLVTSSRDSHRGPDPESAPDLRRLRDQVLEKLAREPDEERDELRRLWLFLWSYATGSSSSKAAAKAHRSGRPPSDLGLARELGLPRHRIPRLKERLGRLIQKQLFVAPA
ncbi:MAG: hypothetical protein V3T72_16040 [Thermoanaerobaculia bacterium]